MCQESVQMCSFDASYTATAHHIQLAEHGPVIERALQARDCNLLTLREIQLADLRARLADLEQAVVGQRGTIANLQHVDARALARHEHDAVLRDVRAIFEL